MRREQEFTSLWIRADDYEFGQLKHGERQYLRATTSFEDSEEYDPMAEYKYGLHFEFAKMQTGERKIREFVKRWGLLGIGSFHDYGSAPFIDLNKEKGYRQTEYIHEVQEEHTIFLTLIRLMHYNEAGHQAEVIELLNKHSRLLQKEVIPINTMKNRIVNIHVNYFSAMKIPDAAARLYEKHIEQWRDGQLINQKHPDQNSIIGLIVKIVIEALMERGLRGAGRSHDGAIRPAISVWKNTHRVGWYIPSLLSAFYLMLWLDIQAGYAWPRCANEECDELFPQHSSIFKYCSEECREKHNGMKTRGRANLKKKLDRAEKKLAKDDSEKNRAKVEKVIQESKAFCEKHGEGKGEWW